MNETVTASGYCTTNYPYTTLTTKIFNCCEDGDVGVYMVFTYNQFEKGFLSSDNVKYVVAQSEEKAKEYVVRSLSEEDFEKYESEELLIEVKKM